MEMQSIWKNIKQAFYWYTYFFQKNIKTNEITPVLLGIISAIQLKLIILFFLNS